MRSGGSWASKREVEEVEMYEETYECVLLAKCTQLQITVRPTCKKETILIYCQYNILYSWTGARRGMLGH
jgi:hypothetical protein